MLNLFSSHDTYVFYEIMYFVIHLMKTHLISTNNIMNEISRIRQQFQSGQWPQFVEHIEIHNIRSWKGQGINFMYPITAIVGENGTGKSTVLKSLACCYEHPTLIKKTYYPSQFFIDTQWETLTDCKITYRIKRGDTSSTFSIRKPTQRWKYPKNRIKRNVFILDISRTLPLDATVGYAKLAKQAQNEVSDVVLSDDNRNQLSYILGRDYDTARFAKTEYDATKEVGLLGRGFGEISQFHQGAGEDATLDLFQVFESIPNNSLLIIDEVEASLHPKAQRRLIQYLLKLSRIKRLQIVVSTHSPYILHELPSEARVLLLPNERDELNIITNISTEFAMSKIDDSDNPELYLYVEDMEAEILIYEIIKHNDPNDNLIPRIKAVIVGPANVVQTMGRLSLNDKLPIAGIGVLDGDIQDTDGCINLPGTTPPELIVFKDLKDRQWPNLENRFGIGASSLFTILEEAMLLPDHHHWINYVGDRIRMSSKSVWQVLAQEWVKSCLPQDEHDRIMMSFTERLENIR